MAQYTRRSAWELQTQDPNSPWDPYTLGYARAVAEMRRRSQVDVDDPTGWTYQAAMHGTYAKKTQDGWNQCQHGTWYFLPWHRMYCWYFEQIVRSIVVEQGGPEDWALPFWNYSASTEFAAMPPAFREPTYDPDGSGKQVENPLFTAHRARKYNRDGEPLPPNATSLAALGSANFTGSPYPGFGGPQTGFSHASGTFGLLEQVPHNVVHVLVGGNRLNPCLEGWMVDPNCAAEDPIFWLHHSNIDRLWSVWNDNGGTNPDDDPAWAGFDEFCFWDATGTRHTMTPAQVTSLSLLDYDYEPQPEPADPGTLRMVPPTARRLEATMADDAPRRAPRLLAANEEPVTLTGGPTNVRVPLTERAPAALRSAVDAADDSVRHVYLNVEALTADETPGTAFEVHVALPDGSAHVVGIVTFFGFDEQLKGDHSLGPMTHTFEITDLVGSVAEAEGLDVSFVPFGGDDDPAQDEPIHGNPRIGRVSVSAD